VGYMGAGCKKSEGIDNNNVIRTPYSLYFSDVNGALHNTNDGSRFKFVFQGDGYVPRAVATSGTNILWIKRNLHLSTNNGSNFNPSNYNVPDQVRGSSILLDAPDHGRVYMISTSAGGNGIEYSEDNGILWKDDTFW